jgi:biotin carboxylase
MQRISGECVVRILVLGGGSDQVAFIEALQARGHDVLFADYNERPLARRTGAPHLRVSTLNVEAVTQAARTERVQRVLTACTDQAVLAAAEVNEHLGFGNAMAVTLARAATNKAWMKVRFLALGVPTARAFDGEGDALRSMLKEQVSVVVKPADCNGSAGVCRIDDPELLPEALSEARSLSRTRTALIEEFLPGDEYSIDVFVVQGRARVIMITRSLKIPSVRGFPIYRSLYDREQQDRLQGPIEGIAQQIADGFGIRTGPMIVQAILTDTGLKVLEFGARIAGGSKHQFIRRVTGFDIMSAYVSALFDEAILDNGIGASVPHAAVTYLYCTPGVVQSVVGLELLQTDGTIESVHFYKPIGATIVAHAASRDRLLSYLTVADSEDDLAVKLRRAQDWLRVTDPSGANLVLRLTSTPLG